jgi:mono/diheme cytochrome c family protein
VSPALPRSAAALAAAALTLALASTLRGAPVVDGKAIYLGKGNCATCHGPEALGTRMAPDLTDGEWLHGEGSLRDIEAVVRTGVPDPLESPVPMPPMGGAALTGEEVSAVARYVHSLSR